MKRKMLAFIAMLLIAALSSSCSGNSIAIDTFNIELPSAPETTAPSVSSLSPDLSEPDPSAELLKTNYASLADFSNVFFNQAAQNSQDDENLIVSPLSAYIALAMLSEGANTTTAEELTSLLGKVDSEAVYALISHLITLEDTLFGCSNSLWIQNDTPIGTSFISTLASYYLSECFQTDITNAEGVINSWISEKTNGIIENMLTPEALDGNLAALVNAVYLDAPWETVFDEALTSERNFTDSNGNARTAVFMYNGNAVESVIDTDDVLGVVLPFKDGSLEFIAVMSKNSDVSVKELCGIISENGGFSALSSSASSQSCALYLPEFSVNSSKNLNEMLTSLGLESLFTPEADLSGIGSAIFVDDIFHSTAIEIREGGAKAAASSVIALRKSEDVTTPDAVLMDFNRPFVFAVHDKDSGAILFAGTYVSVD